MITIPKNGLRLLSIVIAVVIFLQSAGGFAPAGRAYAGASFEASVEASPNAVQAGAIAAINVFVTSSADTSLLVDVEIFDASLKKVHQVFVDNVKAKAGEKTTVPFTWSVPAGLPEGKYIVSFGLFGAGWSAMYDWYAGAASLTVMKGTPTISFASSSAASPAAVEPGGSVTVSTTVTAATYSGALIEIGMIGPDGSNIWTRPFHETFQANESKPLLASWTVPVDAPRGTYQVEVGIYKPDRTETYSLNRTAARFTVGGEPQTPLPAPSRLKAEAAETSISLTWDPVDGATRYELDADGTIIPLASAAYAHTGLQPDTAHTYKVRAGNASVTGDWSPVVTAKTTAAVNTPAIRVSLETSESLNTQMPTVAFKLENASTTAVPLQNVKARYYFTLDGEAPLSVDFWSTVAKQNVTTKFVKMPIPSAAADHYLELGFTDQAGTLNAGSYATVSTWFHKTNWQSFDQKNDYSYLQAPSYTYAEKTPGYISGQLAWGIEPVLSDMPAFPDNIRASSADTSITVTWDPVEGATGYEIVADGTAAVVTGSVFTHEWLRTGTKHLYKVRAIKGDKYSVWSSLLTARTNGEQLLPAPGNARAERFETSIQITWAALEEEITGYDIEVDGSVQSIGTALGYTHAGLAKGSLHTYRVRAKDGATLGPWSEMMKLATVNVPTGPFTVNFTVNSAAERALISPYIYGTNDELTGLENWTSFRIGGNRMTTYNWENNASNAGKDDGWRSDGYVPWFFGNIMDRALWSVPGIGTTAFHDRSLARGAYTLITLQTAGYVAADRNDTAVTETAPNARWAEVKPAKGSPFSLTPDLNDNAVYMDEFVNLLVNKYGPATSATGIKGMEIDNEPGLWAENHKYVHPVQTSGVEVLNKSVALAKAVKNVDPAVELFGPVSYGFSEYLMMDNKAEWETIKGGYSWYLDYYLDKLRAESAKESRRLLDVLDLHWYPEATGGGVRISDPWTANNLETHKARVQAPRSLWDPSYKENSWIGDHYSSFLPLIPRLKQSIGTYNPGTKLAFTEYNYGGEDHISGGIAMADVLGVFGKQGVYMANYWKMVAPEKTAYSTAAARIYNNYDGHNGKFGDTSVQAETTDVENSSIYGSVFEDGDGSLHLIVMNKNFDYEMNAVFRIEGAEAYKSARVWAYDSESPIIGERTGIASIEGNRFELTLPKLTVAHIVLSRQ
jgi:hypothetical protein